VLALRALFDPAAAAGTRTRVELRVSDDRFSVEVSDQQISLSRGRAQDPEAVIETTPQTLLALVTGQRELSEALGDCALSIEGETVAVTRFLGLFTTPAGFAAER
jgi:alkyl sulfatase BDS1-like metallo-beta-lactamase superfamily hydrolase